MLSIITGTYNRLPLLMRMIESVRQDIPPGIPYEIIICDGGSTDGTIEWLKSQPNVVLIEHGALLGAITAFTDAGQLARGKYTLILNDDVEVVPGSILRALIYLEDNFTCGMVAFEDDRFSPYHPNGGFHILMHAAQRGGGDVAVVYGQCCLVRTWLGQHCNWWRGYPEQAFTARTYAGDNLLSSNIWALGYTVDAVPGIRVHDVVVMDGLRAHNNSEGRDQQDSADYYRIFPKGATIPDQPAIPQQDKRQLRVMLLTLYEPGYGHYKNGLRDALAKRYMVFEVDYLAQGRYLGQNLLNWVSLYQPDLMFTQFQNPDAVQPDMLSSLRAYHPRMVMVNWNGDTWEDNLKHPKMLDILRNVDLQLVVNGSVIPYYEQHHIPAAYWQIGYEETPDPLPDMPKHDVVFLASNYSGARAELGAFLLSIGIDIGIYGSGWNGMEGGNTTYDFPAGAALYRNAKLSIGDNQFPDAHGFVSNRLFQALAAGGALLLHQAVPGLEELTGLRDGEHYIQWTALDDLRDKIEYWLKPKQNAKRKKIAAAGTAFVRERHSFDARVRELFGENGLITRSRKTPNRFIPMLFIGALEYGGQVGPVTRKQYNFRRNESTLIDQLDVEPLESTGYWRRI